MLNPPLRLHWSTKRFDELDVHLLHQLLRLRTDVFVVEQQCAYAEIDGQDLHALHVLGQQPDGALVAYARILPPGADGLPHVGRVVVAAEVRRHGLGRQLMHEVMHALSVHHGTTRSALAAQAHLQKFYEGFGYRASGAVYPLDGIPHVDMVRSD